VNVSGRRISKASDIVVQTLRHRIVAERLPAGYRLPSESELVEQFGLGRVTVREGLRLLERDGLIDIRRGPGGGIIVSHPDVDQVSEAMSLHLSLEEVSLRELLVFRQTVEPLAAALAAEHATPTQRKAIMSAAAEQHPPLGDVVDLHVLISEASGNGIFSLVLRTLKIPLSVHFRESRIRNEHYTETSYAHSRIAQAVCDGNAHSAEVAMRKHLDAYATYLEDVGLIDDVIVPADVWEPSR
jgi:GntR family transcriptional repressor for pyruvate dehydrogenase complex